MASAAAPWLRRAAIDIVALRRAGFRVVGKRGEEDVDPNEFYVDLKPELLVGTPYEGGYFRVRLTMTNDAFDAQKNFPFRSPSIGFVPNPIFHPNVHFQNGSVCVNLLNEDWKPTITLLQIMERYLPMLLCNGNPDSPLNGEAGELYSSDMAAFNETAAAMTRKYASVPPVGCAMHPLDPHDARAADRSEMALVRAAVGLTAEDDDSELDDGEVVDPPAPLRLGDTASAEADSEDPQPPSRPAAAVVHVATPRPSTNGFDDMQAALATMGERLDMLRRLTELIGDTVRSNRNDEEDPTSAYSPFASPHDDDEADVGHSAAAAIRADMQQSGLLQQDGTISATASLMLFARAAVMDTTTTVAAAANGANNTAGIDRLVVRLIEEGGADSDSDMDLDSSADNGPDDWMMYAGQQRHTGHFAVDSDIEMSVVVPPMNNVSAPPPTSAVVMSAGAGSLFRPLLEPSYPTLVPDNSSEALAFVRSRTAQQAAPPITLPTTTTTPGGSAAATPPPATEAAGRSRIRRLTRLRGESP